MMTAVLDLTLTPALLATFPDARVELVLAAGLRNDREWPAVAGALTALEADAAAGRWSPAPTDDPRISGWHAAYRAFGSHPRRSRPAHEALARRLGSQARAPRINPAVDAYNLVSLRHAIPSGAFDLSRVDGPVLLRPAVDGDRFTPLGEPGSVECPPVGEIVYAMGSQVLTRHWNHRDADLTKVTPATVDAVFLLEAVCGSASTAALDAAAAELAALLAEHTAAVTRTVLDRAISTRRARA